MSNYIVYHLHSDYSLLDSSTRFEEYVALAVQQGQTALASTEHGKPTGWVSKKMMCDEAGIKFIHGVEIYLTESLENKVRDNYHTVLLAKNMDGVYELNELVTKSCSESHFYYVNRLSFDEFLNISDNIITTSACLASPLNKLQDDHPYYDRLARKYTFLEIQPHIHPDQVAYNRRLFELSKRIGVPLIAGTDTHSADQYKAECRAVLTAAKNKQYADEDAFDLTYHTYDDLVSAFRRQNALPPEVFLEAIENTNRMADMVEPFELDKSIKYPILHGSREEDSRVFQETVDELFEEKLRSGVIPSEQADAFRSAIKEEMRVFQKLQMDGFMLSMSELIRWCKENGMAIGTARGSVGGSRVAYVTDIIDLNPETWHTVFSRFCNEDRKEIGDIDIDCVESDRPAIFKHIIDRFGADKTARVASYGTLKAKGVIDEVCRAKMYEWNIKHGRKKDEKDKDNPFHYDVATKIKSEMPQDLDQQMSTIRKNGGSVSDIPGFQEIYRKYPEVFRYFDGMWDIKISQSVHPAGMVISPVSLERYYGTFNKDGETCLMLDMEEAHEVGVAKYDFLVLKTVQVIRDACRFLGVAYPKTNEIDWEDKNVWESMWKSLAMVFQFEGSYAAECLRKFHPQSIFDMSLVTACIRPSGASYRDALLAHKVHSNPSELIDDLLKDNLGYLIYQEDTIKFLQQICGLSGSEADNIRRAIGRKQKDRLEKALPSILDGYCSKSSRPRGVAEQEAKEFLQVIEDSASYQFGYNHSVAYCLLGYLCAYFRYYHPLEFITSYLNNAANDEDIRIGTEYAGKIGVRVTMPKWGVSKGDYFYDTDNHIIAKGLSSIKYMSAKLADELYDLAQQKHYSFFMDLLWDLDKNTSIDTRQLDILIKLDFFSDFGNQRELLRLTDIYYNMFNRGTAKQIKKAAVEGTPFEPIISKYATGTTKSGGVAKSWSILDLPAVLREAEQAVKAVHMEDLGTLAKVRNFADVMGYVGYISGAQEDRRKLYITDVFPVFRKKDGKQFGYSVLTKSVGSGKEARFTVFSTLYNKDPIKKGEVILCRAFDRDGQYFTLRQYDHIWT